MNRPVHDLDKATSESQSARHEIGAVDFVDWRARLLDVPNHCDSEKDAIVLATELAARLPGVQAAVGFHRIADAPLVPVTSLICKSGVEDEVASWQSHISPSIRDMCKEGRDIFATGLKNGIELITVGIGPVHQPNAVVCVFADTFSQSSDTLRLCMQLLGLEGGEWMVRPANSAQQSSQASADLRLWESCQSQSTQEAFSQLANRLSDRLQEQMVIIGSKSTGRRTCRIESISGSAKVQRPSQLVTQVEDLMSESMIRNDIRAIHTNDIESKHTAVEGKLFQLCNADVIVSGPLQNKAGDIVGAWVVIAQCPSSSDIDDSTANWLNATKSLSETTGCCVDIIRRSRFSLLRRFQAKLGADTARGRKKGLVLAGVLAIVMAIPMPYRVSCRTEIQPVIRRFLPAPYEGILDEVLVGPGDFVEENQVVARMDSREIQWQLSAARAELKRFSKEHDSAMAIRDTSVAQVAELQMKSTQVEIDMLRNRLENLEIRSPIRGVILGGDPRKLEGGRLSLGQTLFEAGLLEKMVVEISIPDREVAFIKAGDTVSTRLDAFPHKMVHGKIARISPQAELKDQDNVFVAEILLENKRNIFRPGMAGWSKVSAGYHPLGWNLFHHAIDNVRSWIGI